MKDKKTKILIAVGAVVLLSVIAVSVFAIFSSKSNTDEPGEIQAGEIDVTVSDDKTAADEPQNESDVKKDVGEVTEETSTQIETLKSVSQSSVLDESEDGKVDQAVIDTAKSSLDGSISMLSEMPPGLTELTSSLQSVSNTYFFGQLTGLDRMYDCVSHGGTVYGDKVYIYDNKQLNENVYKAAFVVTQPSDQYAYKAIVFDGYYDDTVDMFKIINYSAVKDIDAALAGLN